MRVVNTLARSFGHFSRVTIVLLGVVLIAATNTNAQNKIYEFRGTLPPGASSHPEVEDGETFTATFIVNTSVADTLSETYAGNFPGASIIGTVRFSGGYVSTTNFTNGDVNTNDNFPYTVPVDAVWIQSTGIYVMAFTTDGSTFSSDALPASCVSFSTDAGTFNPTMLSFQDPGGTIYYDASMGDNTIFTVTDVDTWTDTSGGFFDEADNWFDGSAPDFCEEAVFDADATYDVTWDSLTGDVVTRSLKIEDGNVLFRSVGSGSGGTIYRYGLTHFAEISGDSFLILGNGTDKHQLNVAGLLNIKDGYLGVYSGSTLNATGTTRMAEENLSAAVLELSGATFDGRGVVIGERGIASVSVEDASVVDVFSVELATRNGSLGGLDVDGIGTVWTTDQTMNIGVSGRGVMNITGGAEVNCLLAAIGSGNDANGEVTVSGPGSTWNLETLLDVGYTDNATGELNIENGGLVSCNAGIRMGVFGTNPDNVINITGADSEMHAFSDIFIGFETGGTVFLSDGGQITTDRELIIGELGTLDLDQPGLSAGVSADQISNVGTIDVKVGSATFEGDVYNNAAMSISSGSNTLIQGRLVHDGTECFISDSSRLRIEGTLSGTSAFTGAGEVRPLGDIEPGELFGIGIAGEINFGGSVLLFPNSDAQMELFSSSIFDRLVVAGDLVIDGDLFVYDEGITLDSGMEFVIIDVSGSTTGQFAGLNEGDVVNTFDGVDLCISYVAGDGNDVALYTEPGGAATVTPDSFNVVNGNFISGGISELAASDNADLSVRRSNSDIQSRVFIEFKATSPSASPSGIEFVFEASVFARTNVVQTIDLYDYVAGTWESVDTSNAARFADSTVTVEATGDLTRFVESGSGCMEARVRFLSANARQRFTANIDQVSWTIMP